MKENDAPEELFEAFGMNQQCVFTMEDWKRCQEQQRVKPGFSREELFKRLEELPVSEEIKKQYLELLK